MAKSISVLLAESVFGRDAPPSTAIYKETDYVLTHQVLPGNQLITHLDLVAVPIPLFDH